MTALIARTLPQLSVLAVGFNINAFVMLLLMILSISGCLGFSKWNWPCGSMAVGRWPRENDRWLKVGEKKHEATQHRRDKAREEGQLARSQDLGSAVVLLGAIGMLMTWGPDVFNFLANFMKRSLSVAEIQDSSADRAVAWVASTFWHSIGVLLPIFAAAMGVALVSNWVQVGFLFLPSKIKLDWSHVNPISGLQRMFSIRNVTRVLFASPKSSWSPRSPAWACGVAGQRS